MRDHPSAITNSSNLNGNDTKTGGTIIMPSDISPDADHEVDHEERQQDDHADDERGLQLGQHERGDHA